MFGPSVLKRLLENPAAGLEYNERNNVRKCGQAEEL